MVNLRSLSKVMILMAVATASLSILGHPYLMRNGDLTPPALSPDQPVTKNVQDGGDQYNNNTVDCCAISGMKAGGEIVLKGKRHSGTNWIHKIIWQNLKKGSTMIMEQNPTGSRKFGWKHGKLYPDGWGKPLSQNEILVVVTRDVFMWLPKMFKEAYDPIMNGKRREGFSKYIRAEYGGICHSEDWPKVCRQINKRGAPYETADNLIQARTQKYKQWLSYESNSSTYTSSKEMFLQNRVHICYESLSTHQDGENGKSRVTPKELQLKFIGDPLKKLCVPMNDTFKEVSSYTKFWGVDKNGNIKDENNWSNKANVKQEETNFMSVYTKDDLRFVLSQLYLEFEKKLGYDYGYVYEMLNED